MVITLHTYNSFITVAIYRHQMVMMDDDEPWRYHTVLTAMPAPVMIGRFTWYVRDKHLPQVHDNIPPFLAKFKVLSTVNWGVQGIVSAVAVLSVVSVEGMLTQSLCV